MSLASALQTSKWKIYEILIASRFCLLLGTRRTVKMEYYYYTCLSDAVFSIVVEKRVQMFNKSLANSTPS